MHILLWTLQVLAALLYSVSGITKVFLFDQVSGEVPSFGALPRAAWLALGLLELLCAVGLVLPAVLRWRPGLTVTAATVLALESLVFIGVHAKYNERGSVLMMALLGLVMAFIAYGRLVLKPITREADTLKAAA